MRRNRWTAVLGTLLAAVALMPSTLVAQIPATERPVATASAAKPDLGYVTPATFAAILVHPQRVLRSPDMEFLPTEVISASGLKEFGIDPCEIEQILVIAEPSAGPPAKVGVVLRSSSPLPQGKILGPLWQGTTEATLDGKTYQKGSEPMGVSIFRVDDRTLIVAQDELLHRMLANHAKPEEGKMTQVLGRVAAPPDVLALVLIEPIRPLLAMPLGMVQLPPDLADVKKVPDLLSSIGIKANLTDEMSVSLTLRAKDDGSATELEAIVDKLLAMGEKLAAAQSARQASSADPVEQAMAKYSQRMSQRILKAIRPVRKGQNLTLAASGNAVAQVGAIGAAAALFYGFRSASGVRMEHAAHATGTMPPPGFGTPANPPTATPTPPSK
jgi:hypothetical protein